MQQTLALLVDGLLIGSILASLAIWLRIASRMHGLPWRLKWEGLLPPRRRPAPFWTPAEAVMMFGLTMVFSLVFIELAARAGWVLRPPIEEASEAAQANSRSVSILVNTAAGLVSTIIIVLWLRLFDADARRKLGLRLSVSEAWLGLKGSLLILPPVLVISALAAQLVEYEHPVLDSLAEMKNPFGLLAIFVGTAVITPVVEEVLLRGLFQGGLQRLADAGGEEGKRWRPQAWWPIGVTSLLFALMHVGQGAAPIPLFLLSVGLGYLYRQTGSLTAPIVVHMVLNGMTLTVALLR